MLRITYVNRKVCSFKVIFMKDCFELISARSAKYRAGRTGGGMDPSKFSRINVVVAYPLTSDLPGHIAS